MSTQKIPKVKKKKKEENTSNYGKVSTYKINTQKSISFLETRDKELGFEIKSIIPFTEWAPQIKYLGINLKKYVQDLYAETTKFCWNKSKKI